MAKVANQNPEQKARDQIDNMLQAAGWAVQSKKKVDLGASKGVAVREYQTDVGSADYVLFVDRKPVGVIEAKREEEGERLTVAEDQSGDYAQSRLKYLDNDALPFVYESTGVLPASPTTAIPSPAPGRYFTFTNPAPSANGARKQKRSGHD